MKQIVQNLWNGEVTLVEQPAPALAPGHVLVRTTRSLISAGTERMLVEFGRSSLIQKARSQPEKVRQVLDKVKTAGVSAAWDSVQAKIDEPLSLGYCNAGIVVDRAPDVIEFAIGDRVASNGAHAEFVVVPRTLCARIPDAVPDDEACFAPLAAIGLQGVRLVAPALGESVAVIGLGLVGLLAAQLLKASGCRVLGFDFNRERLDLARRFGVETVDLDTAADPVARARQLAGTGGVDAVVIATATSSGAPITQAAQMCRQRGRIVLIGVSGLELNRDLFYKKELSFQVSCSYGPGRYDEQYERRAQDYPLGFVRWTAQRNFEASLDAMVGHRLDVRPLVTDRVAHDAAALAYERLLAPDSLGIVLEYPADAPRATRIETPSRGTAPRATSASPVRIGLIGSGSFARSTILPILKSAGADLRGVASHKGLSAAHVARKFGFAYCASNPDDILSDAETTTVFITTPHASHASLIERALATGKHVFVEKPLCIDDDQLQRIEAAYREFAEPRGLQLCVGFNRRFSPLSQTLRTHLQSSSSPKAMVCTVNAGTVPSGHWISDPATSGGRIIGEGCHFIDLLVFLSGAPVSAVQASPSGEGRQTTVTLQHADGSTGTIHYLTSGHRSFPKEQITVFGGGAVYVLDNFRTLRAYGDRKFRSTRLWSQDKGHRQEITAFLRSVGEGLAPIMSFESVVNVTRASLLAVRAAETGRTETL